MGLKVLKDKHILFAQLLMSKVHPTEAAVKSGFSKATAKSAGLKLRKDPLIIDYIKKNSHAPINEILTSKVKEISREVRQAISDAQNKDRFDKYDVTQKRVINEAYIIATLDPAMMFDEKGNPFEIKDMPIEVRHAISDVKITTKQDQAGNTWTEHQVKFHSKLQAIQIVISNTEKEKEKILERSAEERAEKLKELEEKARRFKQ